MDATTGSLAGALLFYWALGSTPLSFRQNCTLCYNKMAEVGRQIEDCKFEHGELPANLKPFGSPGCPELEASGLGRWLYGLHGIKLVPYRYQVQGDSFTLSCETGTHDWGGGPPKGYPRYSTSTGVVQRP